MYAYQSGVAEERRRLIVDTNWMADGKCRELPPETFFPSDGVGVEIARRICADCPVKAPCLEYALYNRIEHGVWGGASERERRRIARARRGGLPRTVAVDSRLEPSAGSS
jgi:WhiB family redox-sensing transcriptional regulator